MACKVEERGMKADGIANALQHDALKIVVEQDPGKSTPGGEGSDMAAQKVLHCGIEEEAQVDIARITEHHDEGHERPYRPADFELPEVGPINLTLLSHQCAQAQIGFSLSARAVARDDVAKVIGAPGISALPDHGVEPAGGEGG